MPESIELSIKLSPVPRPRGRASLWFQGCPLRCPGCCNPEMLPFDGGQRVALVDVLRDLEMAASEHGIEGVTFLGGEPLAHASGAAALRGRCVNAVYGDDLQRLHPGRTRLAGACRRGVAPR